MNIKWAYPLGALGMVAPAETGPPILAGLGCQHTRQLNLERIPENVEIKPNQVYSTL